MGFWGFGVIVAFLIENRSLICLVNREQTLLSLVNLRMMFTKSLEVFAKGLRGLLRV